MSRVTTHVEGHAAGLMHKTKARYGTLAPNKQPRGQGPAAYVERSEPFTGGVAQVATKADEQLAVYAELAPGRFPGLALEVEQDYPEGLSIGVTPHGWTLIRADDDADSWRTVGAGTEGKHAMVWSVPDDLEADWFVSREAARTGIEYWPWVGNW